MGQHDPLGFASRPRGVHDDGNVIRGGRRRDPGLRLGIVCAARPGLGLEDPQVLKRLEGLDLRRRKQIKK